MSEERIDKLGTYFIHQNILQSYGITFERFVYLVDNNLWEEYV